MCAKFEPIAQVHMYLRFGRQSILEKHPCAYRVALLENRKNHDCSHLIAWKKHQGQRALQIFGGNQMIERHLRCDQK